MICTILALSASLFTPKSLSEARALTRSFLLDTGWSVAVTRPDQYSEPGQIPSSSWTSTAMPRFEFLPNPGTRAGMWFKTTLKAELAGAVGTLVFQQALYTPEVFIDGVKVDAWVNGWTPHEVEVTRFLRDGKSHELAVHCFDRNASTPDGTIFTEDESKLRGKVIFPIGGYKDLTGLIRPVSLRIDPRSHFQGSDLLIDSSVRTHTLHLSDKVRNAPAGSTVSISIYDANNRLAGKGTAKVDPRGSWHWEKDWTNPHLWAPEHPYLYRLKLQLLHDGVVLNELERRFGYRELWTEGQNFFLNGTKRHFLASATWPVADQLSRDEIRRRLRSVKAQHVVAFRCHIGPWQEEFLDVADEEGLMIIDEAPVYTDGAGFYAYKNPRFWANYRDVVKGIIQRDRNHASLVMWSLGNEIRFMGNEKYDADLPKRMGDLGRFAKRVDPTRPITFEADLDPDGAYDVIGLHYPHELPDQHAYPASADWIGDRRTTTDAAGGMLGTTSTDFVWDRKKPLYIGEYLWCPQGDFSPGSVFFGEDAYLDKDAHNNLGKSKAWVDQTLAYRLANVSGVSPWTPFGFGIETVDKVGAEAVRFAYKPVAAYLVNKAVRSFAGERKIVSFNLFNDTELGRNLVFELNAGGSHGKTHFSIAAGEHARAEAILDLSGSGRITWRLLEGSHVWDSGSTEFEVDPSQAVTAPSAFKLVRWDRASKVKISSLDPSRTVLVIQPHSLDVPMSKAANGLPVVGGTSFPSSDFLRFVHDGGRALVLEQNSLDGLGLGVRTQEYASTIAFPSAVFLSDKPGDLKFWGKDNFVTRHEIVRSGIGGMRSLAVSGGPEGLKHAPLVEMSFGAGTVVLSQFLIGEKSSTEPAAIKLEQRLIDHLCEATSVRGGHVLVVAASPEVRDLLNSLALDAEFLPAAPTDEQLAKSAGVIVDSDLPQFSSVVDRAVNAGKAVYWVRQKQSLLPHPVGPGLTDESAASVPFLRNRESSLIDGITREELTVTTPPRDWNRVIDIKANTVSHRLLPSKISVETHEIKLKGFQFDHGALIDSKLVFKQRGTASAMITVPKTGWYKLDFEAELDANESKPVEIFANGAVVDRHVVSGVTAPLSSLVPLHAGDNEVGIKYSGGGDWAHGAALTVSRCTLSDCLEYPAGVSQLIGPGALVSWSSSSGRILADGFDWATDPDHRAKAGIYVGALLGNLGFPFKPRVGLASNALPNSKFKIESGLYNQATPGEITLRTNGSAVLQFYVAQTRSYDLSTVLASSGVKGVYSLLEFEVDNLKVGSAQSTQESDKRYFVSKVSLNKGVHQLRVRFVNDAAEGKEDRNAYIHEIALGD